MPVLVNNISLILFLMRFVAPHRNTFLILFLFRFNLILDRQVILYFFGLMHKDHDAVCLQFRKLERLRIFDEQRLSILWMSCPDHRPILVSSLYF